MSMRGMAPDGVRAPRAVPAARPEPDEAAREALERLTDSLPPPLRAFRDLGLIGPGRRWRLEEALRRRTRTLTLAIHGVHDPHNQAAVLRTAEAFGLQEVHVIRHAGTHFEPARGVTKHADRWLDIVRHEDFQAALRQFHERGMQVLAAAVKEEATPFYDVDYCVPTAVVLGNEAEGLPHEVVEACDDAVVIPMYGLTQSLNISVAAAVIASHAVEARRRRHGSVGDLSGVEKMRLRIQWYRRAAGRRVPKTLATELDKLNQELSRSSTCRKEPIP